MRMVPINMEMPKGLLEVNGEPFIERIIKQLHEVGIKEIYVVVGFMKEKYEYLIDEYGVELVVNADYAAKNKLHSVKLAKEHLENVYIWNAQKVFPVRKSVQRSEKFDLESLAILILLKSTSEKHNLSMGWKLLVCVQKIRNISRRFLL